MPRGGFWFAPPLTLVVASVGGAKQDPPTSKVPSGQTSRPLSCERGVRPLFIISIHTNNQTLDSLRRMVVQRLYLFSGGRSSCSPMFVFWLRYAWCFLPPARLTRKAAQAEFWVASPIRA